MRHSYLISTLAASLVSVLLLLPPAGSLFASDQTSYFSTIWLIERGEILAGRLPLWTRHLFLGFPIFADSEACLFYPVQWPFVLAGPRYGIPLSILLHSVIAFLGSRALARNLGAGEEKAALAGAGYVTSIVFLVRLPYHLTVTYGLSWIPVLLASLVSVWRRKDGSFPAAAAACGLLILSGHPQYAYIGLIASILLALGMPRADDLPGGGGIPARLLSAALVWAAGAAAASIQIIPTIVYSFETARDLSMGADYVAGTSAFHPAAIPLLVHPTALGGPLDGGFFGNWGGYGGPDYARSSFMAATTLSPGIIGLAAIIAAFIERKRGLVTALLFVSAGLFLSFGRYNPLFFLATHMPGFDAFREPTRYGALIPIGCVAAMASLDGKEAGRGLRRLLLLPLSIVAFAAAGLLVEEGPASFGEYMARYLEVGSGYGFIPWIIIPALLAVSVLLLCKPSRAAGLVLPIAAVVCAAIFSCPARPNTAEAGDPSPDPALEEVLLGHSAGLSPDRSREILEGTVLLADPAVLPWNRPALLGLSSLTGYSSLVPEGSNAIAEGIYGADPSAGLTRPDLPWPTLIVLRRSAPPPPNSLKIFESEASAVYSRSEPALLYIPGARTTLLRASSAMRFTTDRGGRLYLPFRPSSFLEVRLDGNPVPIESSGPYSSLRVSPGEHLLETGPRLGSLIAGTLISLASLLGLLSLRWRKG